MSAVTASEARARLFPLIQQVNDNAEAIEIVSRSHGRAVLVSGAEWDSIQETLHIFGSQANAQHVLTSLAQLEHGEVKVLSADEFE
jgi:antitoxin YefM